MTPLLSRFVRKSRRARPGPITWPLTSAQRPSVRVSARLQTRGAASRASRRRSDSDALSPAAAPGRDRLDAGIPRRPARRRRSLAGIAAAGSDRNGFGQPLRRRGNLVDHPVNERWRIAGIGILEHHGKFFRPGRRGAPRQRRRDVPAVRGVLARDRLIRFERRALDGDLLRRGPAPQAWHAANNVRAHGESRLSSLLHTLTTYRPRAAPSSSVANASGNASISIVRDNTQAPAVWLEVGPTPPDVPSRVHRTHHRVDSEQLRAAQDERQHRRMQLRPAGQARRGDAAVVHHRPRQPGERLAADHVHGAAHVAFSSGRVPICSPLRARNSLLAPSAPQVIMLAVLPVSAVT